MRKFTNFKLGNIVLCNQTELTFLEMFWFFGIALTRNYGQAPQMVVDANDMDNLQWQIIQNLILVILHLKFRIKNVYSLRNYIVELEIVVPL